MSIIRFSFMRFSTCICNLWYLKSGVIFRRLLEIFMLKNYHKWVLNQNFPHIGYQIFHDDNCSMKIFVLLCFFPFNCFHTSISRWQSSVLTGIHKKGLCILRTQDKSCYDALVVLENQVTIFWLSFEELWGGSTYLAAAYYFTKHFPKQWLSLLGSLGLLGAVPYCLPWLTM